MPKISKKKSGALVRSLADFRDTISAGEQEALDAILLSFGNQVMNAPSGEGLFSDEVAGAVAEARGVLRRELAGTGEAELAATTLTTVTLTTVAASHPWIGC